MAAQLGKLLGTWLWKRKAIEKSQIDEIRYAFEILCSEFLEVIVIIGYGFITNQLIMTFLYLIIFHILRDCFQGYHANTIWKCFLFTIGAYLVSMYSYHYVTIYLLITFLIVSVLLQVSYCIVHNVMKPMIISMSFIIIAIMIAPFGFTNIIQLLAVVNLIVSISSLSERRETE